MALTGRPDGPPLAAPGGPASQVRRGLARFAELTSSRTGRRPQLPESALLGERAALAGLRRNGPSSCGGAFRPVATGDGWVGVSLPREADLDLVPALVERPVPGDPWDAVGRWAATRTSDAVVERIRLLGLAGAALDEPVDGPARHPVVLTPGGARRRSRRGRPRVVDLTSLWAGPLCAHLLGLAGAEVIKVEDVRRPDGARRGSAAFFDLLHAGHRAVAVDLRSPDDVARLRTLITDADLVLDSSRARALRQVGLDAAEIVADGTSWLSITAYGRDADRIGFGDDVAAGAGLIALDRGEPLPCGDALADPLTGVTAAVAAAAALGDHRAQLIDVSMHDACRASLGAAPVRHEVVRRGETWWVETDDGAFPVREPFARPAAGRAPAIDADTEELLP